MGVPDLILLRHGRSEWNDLNLFTGWQDVDLSPRGWPKPRWPGSSWPAEARSGPACRPHVAPHAGDPHRQYRPGQRRAFLAEVRRSWRLNERHYGDLTGKDKKQTADEFGLEQVKIWRRSFDVAPPKMPLDDPRNNRYDSRYRDVLADLIPRSECLKDVVTRATPYLRDVMSEDLRSEGVHGGAVLVVAHGNSIRALRMVLQNIGEERDHRTRDPHGHPLPADPR